MRSAPAPRMTSAVCKQELTARARRRRSRGVTLLEYVMLLTFVVVPSIGAAIAGYDALYGWYVRFVRDVSQSSP